MMRKQENKRNEKKNLASLMNMDTKFLYKIAGNHILRPVLEFRKLAEKFSLATQAPELPTCSLVLVIKLLCAHQTGPGREGGCPGSNSGFVT